MNLVRRHVGCCSGAVVLEHSTLKEVALKNGLYVLEGDFWRKGNGGDRLSVTAVIHGIHKTTSQPLLFVTVDDRRVYRRQCEIRFGD